MPADLRGESDTLDRARQDVERFPLHPYIRRILDHLAHRAEEGRAPPPSQPVQTPARGRTPLAPVWAAPLLTAAPDRRREKSNLLILYPCTPHDAP